MVAVFQTGDRGARVVADKVFQLQEAGQEHLVKQVELITTGNLDVVEFTKDKVPRNGLAFMPCFLVVCIEF